MLGHRRARRRGMVMGAAIASSRSRKQVDVAPAPEPPVSSNDNIEQLKQLAELRDQGILTEEEFAAKKKKLLGL